MNHWFKSSQILIPIRRSPKWSNLRQRNSLDIVPNFSGVFDRDSTQTLYLFVDVKTEGTTTWPAVVDALEPLRSNGWLTKVNGTTVTKGPITVVGTGLNFAY